jgi:hypothetical protein
MPLRAGPRPLWSPPAGIPAQDLVHVGTPDLAGLLRQRSYSSRPALITVPQPPGLYRPLLYPTSIAGTAGLTLDLTVVHPVGKRDAEYVHDDNALQLGFKPRSTGSCQWSLPPPVRSTPRLCASFTTSHALKRMPPSSTPSRTPSGRPRRPSSSANAAEQRSLDSGWRRSCAAAGPQLHGSLGSTGQRPMPPHC